MGFFSKKPSEREQRERHEYRLYAIGLGLINDVVEKVGSGEYLPDKYSDDEAFAILLRMNNYVAFVNRKGLKTHNLWDHFDRFE